MTIDMARLDELVINKLRVWNPAAGPAELERPLRELDLDSLDTLEVTHLLEREVKIKVPKAELAGIPTLRGYIDRFAEAAQDR